MEARQISKLLFAGAALTLVYGAASSARAGEVSSADPFASVETIEKLDLDGLRGADGDVFHVFEKHTTTSATNTANNTTNVVIDTSGGPGGPGGMGGPDGMGGMGGMGGDAGNVIGGDVYYNGGALENFSGMYTGAVNTAPGGIASALTSFSLTLYP